MVCDMTVVSLLAASHVDRAATDAHTVAGNGGFQEDRKIFDPVFNVHISANCC